MFNNGILLRPTIETLIKSITHLEKLKELQNKIGFYISDVNLLKKVRKWKLTCKYCSDRYWFEMLNIFLGVYYYRSCKLSTTNIRQRLRAPRIFG